MQIELKVNGKRCLVNLEPYDSLLKVLRVDLGLTGAKQGCDYGGCGACTVLLEGKAVYSCMMPARKAAGKNVETIEGLEKGGRLHPVQRAFVDGAAFQCGFCTPGIIMSAKALLDRNNRPSEDDVREAIIGNLCRCTGYIKILDAILEATGKVRERD